MAVNLEKRVAALERQVAQLRKASGGSSGGREWVNDLYGKFKGDPVFEQAMKLGRKYRSSLRPRKGKESPAR